MKGDGIVGGLTPELSGVAEVPDWQPSMMGRLEYAEMPECLCGTPELEFVVIPDWSCGTIDLEYAMMQDSKRGTIDLEYAGMLDSQCDTMQHDLDCAHGY
jgi:hypothetical protein